MREYPDYQFGTVRSIALDKGENLAASTCIGGISNKKYGRIGAAPIIAAGKYEDHASCGFSSIGHGEYFIQNVVAYDIALKMKYLFSNLDVVLKS